MREGHVATAERSQVLVACAVTEGALAAAGLAARQASHWAAGAGWPVNDCTDLSLFQLSLSNAAVALCLAAAVTGGRHILLKAWPAFAASTETSNSQMLTNLEPLDVVLVAFASGVGEELLFRGALLPLVAPDWRGALVAGGVFGALHVSGGRNAAFAIWASVVGVAYGAAAVATSDVAVPAAAHAAANLASALAWKLRQRPPPH